MRNLAVNCVRKILCTIFKCTNVDMPYEFLATFKKFFYHNLPCIFLELLKLLKLEAHICSENSEKIHGHLW